MNERTYNVLFLCTGNSARSVMAEVVLNTLGKGKFKAFSAGSHPAGRVNPFTIEQLQKGGHTVDGLRSKSWDEFAAPDAPAMDFVITVCDNAAGEVCPMWPGQPMTAHWGFEDPAAVVGTDEQIRSKFHEVYHQIARRLGVFLALPLEKLDRMALQKQVREIGSTQA
jgi:arsenate reductase